jgi:hypothetical protein
MAQLIQEAKRFQKLAGIITEEIDKNTLTQLSNKYGSWDSGVTLFLSLEKKEDIEIACVLFKIVDLNEENKQIRVKLDMNNNEFRKVIGDENLLKTYEKKNVEGWALEYNPGKDEWSFAKTSNSNGGTVPEFAAKQGFFSSVLGKKDSMLKATAVNKPFNNALKEIATAINPNAQSGNIQTLAVK